MDQRRWEQIEELLQAALDLEQRARGAFLDRACGGDEALRRELEELLSAEPDAERFTGSPALSSDAEADSERPRGLSAGDRIGHYRIESWIGAGGMGEVYKARDELLPRVVALKMLPAKFTADAGRVSRFEHEARAASALNHPNIITIFEILHTEGGTGGGAGGAHFIVTEYVAGRTLRQALIDPATNAQRKVGVEEALDIALQVANALKAAHTAWIIHRDIKPENIILRSDGLVKVLDFGIAKLTGESQQETSPVGDDDEDSTSETGATTLTRPGTILGTAPYMSPEQARGEPLDGRTDLFSLGAVLYEMVAGAKLLANTTRAQALQTTHGGREPLPPEARFDHAPKQLERIIRKMLRNRREERYASADELLQDLTTLKRRLESRASRRVAKLGALALALAVMLAAAAAALSVNEVWEERLMRDGHTGASRQAVFSPDGRSLVSVGEDRQVILWDFARRERLATFTEHQDWVNSVAFSPDGKRFATASSDRTVVIRDAARLATAAVLRGHKEPIWAVAFSPDGRLLASSAESPLEHRTILWDTSRWQKVRELPRGIGFGPLLFSTDSRVMTFSGRQWDLTTGEQISFDALGWNWAAFSPDARRMITTDHTGEVAFLNLARRGEIAGSRRLAHSRAHQDYGRAVAFSPDGRLAASGAENILLWDAATMARLGRFEYDAIVWGLSFSPDGHWLVSTHGDGAILVWDMAQRRREASFNGHSDAVRAVAFSPDGKRFASAGEDRSVIVWDAAGGRKELVLNGHRTRVIGVAFSPDGRWLASSDQDSDVIRWDLETRQPRWQINTPGRDNVCLSLSPNGRWLATRPGVYDSSDGRKVLDFHDTPLRVSTEGVAFSPDGRRLACAGYLKICVWETGGWRIVDQQETSDDPPVSVSFAPDGRRLVTGSINGTVEIWEVAPLRRIATLGRHTARVKSLTFSPDGKTVASAGDDKMIALWDVDRRKLVSRIGTHTSPVYAIAFSPDGRHLVSGEHDRSVRLYTRIRTVWGRRLN